MSNKIESFRVPGGQQDHILYLREIKRSESWRESLEFTADIKRAAPEAEWTGKGEREAVSANYSFCQFDQRKEGVKRTT